MRVSGIICTKRKGNKMELNGTVKKWLKKCKQQNYSFAQIITSGAIFDRVAIVSAIGQNITITYPKQYKRRWQIETETVQLPDCKIRYYKD